MSTTSPSCTIVASSGSRLLVYTSCTPNAGFGMSTYRYASSSIAACSCGGHDVQLPGWLNVTPAISLPASTFLPTSTLRSRCADGPPAAKCSPGSRWTSANDTNCTGCVLVTGAAVPATSQPDARRVTGTSLRRGTYSE